MAAFVPISGPVVADTAYCNSKRVARDVSISLPEVAPMTADVQAMGTMSIPVWQLIENMETTITKIGVDEGLRDLIRPEKNTLEFRWVQTVTDAAGVTKEVGCKAFVTGVPNKIPGISLEIGSASESEVTYMTTRYALYVDGKEVLLVDRLSGILRVNGKDYAKNLNSLL